MGRAQQRLINPHAKQGFNAGVVYSVQSTFNATTQEHSEHTHTLTHNTHTHTNASTSESTRSTGLLFSSLQHNSHMFHLQQQVTMELHWTHAHHTSTCVHTPLAAHMGQLHGSAYPCSAGPVLLQFLIFRCKIYRHPQCRTLLSALPTLLHTAPSMPHMH
mmetsp:Transcript_2809/g.7360  ORF Transcript_2809/g.7360 Transcript_2809/m.7360 type:complete len:160 (-) Transcript_2809:310-789(-)|eukprot:264473-Pelagomonas_calceolata.AAC.2